MKLALANCGAIAFGLLPTLVIVGSEFWQALVTRAVADDIYAFILEGLLLFSGFALVMICCEKQTHVTGWYNPVFLYKAYVDVGSIALS
jgi:hypothetical protein